MVDQQAESAFVESQVEILRSAGVAAAVVRELKLADNPEFVPPKGRAAAVAALDASAPGYLDDVHGDAVWRAAMARRAVAEVVAELAR